MANRLKLKEQQKKEQKHFEKLREIAKHEKQVKFRQWQEKMWANLNSNLQKHDERRRPNFMNLFDKAKEKHFEPLLEHFESFTEPE